MFLLTPSNFLTFTGKKNITIADRKIKKEAIIMGGPGGVGKAGGAKGGDRPFIFADLDSQMMTRFNDRTEKHEYKVGAHGPIAKSAKDAKALYAKQLKAKGANYVFAEDKITAKTGASGRKAVLKEAKQFGASGLLKKGPQSKPVKWPTP